MRSIVIFDSRFDRSPVRGLIPYFTLSSHLHTTPHFSDSSLIMNDIKDLNKDKLVQFLLKNNSKYVSNDLINQMNVDIASILKIVEILSDELTINEMNKFIEKIVIDCSLMGVSENEFKKLIRIINKESKTYYNKVDIEPDFIKNLVDIVSQKEIELNDKYLKKIRKIFYLSHELVCLEGFDEKGVKLLKNELNTEIMNVFKIKTYKSGRKGREKKCNNSYYKGEIQRIIGNTLRSMIEKYTNYLDNLIGKNLINLRHNFKEVGIEFKREFNSRIDSILTSSSVLVLPSNINSREIFIDAKFGLSIDLHSKFSFKNLDLLPIIDKISSLEMSLAKRKENRLDIDSPLIQILSEVINSDIKDNKLKQAMLEQKLLQYDEEWFKANIENSAEVKSILLHDIYNKLDRGLNKITHRYKINNYSLFLNNIGDVQKNLDIVPILVIFYLGNDKVINIMFKTIIEILGSSGGVARNTLGIEIGKTLKNRALFLKKASLKVLNKLDCKELIKNMSDEDLSHLGDSLISLLLKYTNVFNMVLIVENNKKTNLISIKPEYISKLGVSCISLTRLPMLSPPNEPDKNGYYSPYLNPEIYHFYNPVNTIIKQKFDNIHPTSNIRVLTDIIKKLNKTRFIINKKVLNFLITEWSNKNSILFKGSNNLMEEKENATKDELLKIQTHNSIYWNFLNTLRIAELFQDTSFYLPTFADFRGRIYSLSTYLSYQGGDLARGLLNFADAEEITEDGLNYLALYLANVGGKSKLSKKNKINWAFKNTIEIVENSHKGGEFLLSEYFLKGDEPIQYISCVLAMAEALEASVDNKPVTIHTPILFDASCNGMQHLAALTREIDLATNVNLIKETDNTENDVPYDFYQIAGNLIEQEISQLKDSQFDKLKGIRIDRRLVKKPIMTIPYNISLNGMSEQLVEYIKLSWEGKKPIYTVPTELSKNNAPIFLTGKEFGKFASIVFKTLTEKIPSIKFISNYLNSIIGILLKLDRPITWITPIGLKINLSTRTFKNVRTTSKLIENSKPVTISIPTNSLDKMAIKRSFMPNLIHSMDATNIHLLSNYLEDEPIYTIHDCFATSPNNMKNLEIFVKEALIEMYFGEISYLERMHLSLLEQIQSYTPLYNKEDKIERELNPIFSYYVIINEEKLYLPALPETFYSKELRRRFIKGIRESIFLIS